MRKMLIIIMLVCLLVGCSFNEMTNAKMHVEDSSISYDVTLIMENASISNIVIDNFEGNAQQKDAIEQVIEDIIGTQTINVKTVSGYEDISNSIMNSVEMLLEKMNVDASLFINQENIETIMENEHIYDDIVIGAGVAGLSAAISLAQRGHDILLLEKMPYAGGATYLSGGEIAVPLLDEVSEDPQEVFLQDMYIGSNYTGDYDKLKKIAYNMDEVYQWLQDDIKVSFHDEPYTVNEHSAARINLPVERGKGLIDKLLLKVNELGIDILYNNEATSLIKENNKVVGVNVLSNKDENKQYRAKNKVILATGGFAYNKELLMKYNQTWENISELTSTVPSGSNGDGILMGIEVGAAITDMDKIQIFPFTNPATGVNHYLENVRTLHGAILVNKEGERFVDEQASRTVLSQEILKQTAQTVFQVFNQEIYDETLSFSYAKETYDLAKEQGVLFSCDELEQCCLEAGIAKKLIDVYTADGPYYVLLGKPSVHYTMGGLVTDEHSRVLDDQGKPIDGLYAIGEVVGGTFGQNRLGATSIDDALVNGYMIE